MSGDSSHVKIEEFLAEELRHGPPGFRWESIPDGFEDAQQQSFNSSDTFGDPCGSKRMSSPAGPCGLSREDAQDLISSDELQPCMDQMPYMQMGDMMQSYDDAMLFGPMPGQPQLNEYCHADNSGAAMDETMSAMGLHNMMPQMPENSTLSAQTVGPTDVYSQQWVSRQGGQGLEPSAACQPPPMVHAYPIMAYPMQHQYQAGKQVNAGYQMMGYYPGNPGWQYMDGPCGPGWMRPAPMHMMEMDMRMTMNQHQQPQMHPAAMGMHNHMQPMRQRHPHGQLQQPCTMPCGTRPGPWGQPQPQPQRPTMQYYHPGSQMSSASVNNLPNCRPDSGSPCQYPHMPPSGLNGGCYPAQGPGPGPPSPPKEEARDMWLQSEPAPAASPPRAASPQPCQTPRSCVAERESEREDDEEISDDEEPHGTAEVLHHVKVEPLKVPHHMSSSRAAPHREANWSPRRQGAAPTAKCSRMECLERYREKKRKRLHQPTVRYVMRKINADNRPRIKGRFVKACRTGDAVDLYGV